MAIPTLSTASSSTKSGDADDAESEATPRAVPLSSHASVALPIANGAYCGDIHDKRAIIDFDYPRSALCGIRSSTTTFGFRMGPSRQSKRDGIAFEFCPL